MSRGAIDLSRLNPAQREAACAGDAPLLVLAGAGTGKTTVITYRIAWLMAEAGVRPDQILAVTFTNKAAKEMRARAGELSGLGPSALDIGTFHGTCGRLLRRHGHLLGLDRHFLIYDADDQVSLMRRCCADLGFDAQTAFVRRLRSKIESWKNQGLGPGEVTPFDDDAFRAAKLYGLYEKRCLEANAVDFGDMLLHTLTLLRRHDAVRHELRGRWSHILVDEYQDTNRVQYEVLRQLAGPEQSLTVVGDDDQSIYRWRGADIGNILRFENDFPGAVVVRLELNYRSTQNILSAANAVIAHNAARKGKTLYTEGDAGEPLTLRLYDSERDEGEAVAYGIEETVAGGVAPSEVVALYRTNAQSRPIEDALRRRRIAYAVYGGIRFYDRREIRDSLAYLRLINNPRSDVDFLRVVNAPARGIGKTSLERLAALAGERGVALFDAARLASAGAGKIGGRQRKQLGAFAQLIDDMREHAADAHPGRLLEEILETSGYRAALRQEGTEEAQDRLDNIDELLQAIDEYVALAPEASLTDFLEEAALATDVDQMADAGDSVSLMTLHSAKGLEFHTVFLAGMEEGVFPHRRSVDERAALEEERRLCYVGLTRAKRRVHLSAARRRFTFGEATYSNLSRFLAEIPSELLDLGAGASARPTPAPARDPGWDSAFDDAAFTPAPTLGAGDLPVHREERSGGGFQPGMTVFHATFGEGTLIAVDGSGPRQKLVVEFPEEGRKTIVARFVEPR